MLTRLIRKGLAPLGVDVRRASRLPLPVVHHCRCDEHEFPFWIVNAHAASWWMKPEVRFDAEMRFLKRASGPGAVVLEVGAHHGMHTLQLARWVGESGSVHAFELNAENALALSANVGLNRLAQVHVHHAAVGEREGRLAVDGERVAAGQTLVESLTLDGYCRHAGLARVDLVKVDVEGFEGRVLAGARALLASRPRIALELHLDELGRYGDSVASVWSAVAAEDYEIEMMTRPDWENTRAIHHLSDLPSSGVVNLFLQARTG